MNKKTVIGLGAVAIALFAFIVLYERHTLTSGELSSREGRLLDRLVRDRVTEVILERGGERTVVVREREEEDELGEWHMTAPVDAGADQEAVSSLLGSLEWADARRTMEANDADLAEFGLAEPRVRATLRIANEELRLAVGGEAPGGVYLRIDDEPTVHVVGLDVFEALDHESGHFRAKELVSGFDAERVDRLALTRDGATQRLSRDGTRWWTDEPAHVLAAGGRAEMALTTLVELTAARYVTDSPEDLATYGLDAPTLELVATASGTEGAEGAELHLRVGGACADHESERYVRVGDGPVACVTDTSLEALRVAPDALVERRLVTIPEARVTRLVLELDGARLEVEERDGSWHYAYARGASRSEGAVDPAALEDWLEAIRRLRAEQVVPAEVGAYEAAGLETPRGSLVVRGTGDDGEETVLIGARIGEYTQLRRGEEAAVVRFGAPLESLLEPSPVRLRTRLLVRDSADNLRVLTIARGAVTERVEKDGQGFAVTRPVTTRAGRADVEEAARRLASLEAVRFVAERAAPEHGLDAPRFVVTARFEGALPAEEEEEDLLDDEHDHDHGEPARGEDPGPREHVLRIGASTTEGAFATFGDDPAVFVVPESLVETVASPLVSRTQLSTSSEAVESLSLEREGRTVTLRHGELAWETSDGPADGERTRELLDALEGLRAVGATGYGPAPAEQGLDAPRARLVVRRMAEADPPSSYTLLVGAEAEIRGEPRVYVRREDLDVGFTVPARMVRPILDYRP